MTQTMPKFQELIDQGVLQIGDGYRAKHIELGFGGPIFLRAVHLQDSGFSFQGAQRFSKDLAQKVSSKVAKTGDVVITTKGNSTGRTGFVSSSMPTFVYSPHLSFWRSLDRNVIDPVFLRNWARGPEFRSQLEGLKGQTDMAPYLSLGDQRNLRISLPEIVQQQAIASILGALDDKIELNREMNRTLEATAQAIFRSWFVDFDPVVAKAEGRKPFGLSDEIAALFPDRFVESELGPIPEGWVIGTLKHIASVVMGQSPPGDTYNTEGLGLPLLNGPSEFGDYFPTKVKWTTHTTRVSRHDDLIFCVRGSTTGRRVKSDGEYCLGRGVCALRATGNWQPYIDCTIELHLDHLLTLATGSTFPNLSRRSLESFRVLEPPLAILRSFTELTQDFLQMVARSHKENRTLAALRDLLLPKLLSGEIRVQQAEKAVEEVL